MYHVPSQVGRVAVVTGSNSGTGREAARRLAGAGARVIMAVRNLDKGEAAKRDIVAAHPRAQLEVRHLDLAALSSVADFANGLLEERVVVHLLLNNAGVMAPPKRVETVDGFELQMASNFLGHFALTARLMPLLLEAGGGRVVTMSSTVAAYGSIRFRDLQHQRRYVPYLTYAQSKLAELLFANHLAVLVNERRWNLISTAAHPGYTRTNLQVAGASIGRAMERSSFIKKLVFLPSQEPEQGAEPMLYAATSPEAINGAYYEPGGLFHLVGPTNYARMPRAARSADKAARLFDVAQELTGVPFPHAEI